MKRHLSKTGLLTLVFLANCLFSCVKSAQAEAFPSSLLRETTVLAGSATLGQCQQMVLSSGIQAGLGSLATEHWIHRVVQLAAQTPETVVFFAVDLPFSNRVNARLLVSTDGLSDRNVTLLTETLAAIGTVSVPSLGWVTCEISNSNARSTRRDLAASEVQQQVWKSAFAATSEQTPHLAIVLPPYVKETIAELQPSLPEFLGGSAAHPMLSELQSVVMNYRAEPTGLQIVIDCESELATQQWQAFLPIALQMVVKSVGLNEATLTQWHEILATAEMSANERKLTVDLDLMRQPNTLQSTLQRAILGLDHRAAQAIAEQRCRELVRAMHSYHEAEGAFPGYGPRAGTLPSGLSWRVHLLPYLGHQELYDRFHLDESWDSAHNLTLLDLMPEIFQPIVAIDATTPIAANHTPFLSPSSLQTVFGQSQPIRFNDITDGSSNTIVLVEAQASAAVPWTSPQDYRFDAADPTAGMQSRAGRFTIARLDGSVDSLSVSVKPRVWAALFTRNGGEVVNREDLGD